jgi:putative thioredoxin
MTSESFSRPGAVDLSGLRTSAGSPGATSGQTGAPGEGTAGGGYVVEVTETNFQTEVVERSVTAPVVLDFWATWCQPCKQLSPVLERLATEYAGRFLLGTIDVDKNPRIAQAAGVQSIPLVVAVVRGQLVPLFQGALPEGQVRQFIDELLRLSESQGASGTHQPVGGAQVEPATDEPARDPRYAEADAALEGGDLDGAIAAFERLLAQSPSDAEAIRGLARAKLLRRVAALGSGTDVRAEAAAKPDDARVQCAVADLDVAGGHVADAFSRLVDTVRRTSGDERNAVRLHLLELFEAVGPDDERVRQGRKDLSAALF